MIAIDHACDAFEEVTLLELMRVAGGADPDPDKSFGRIGPGNKWQWLGNYFSPEARQHDGDVRRGLAQGYSPIVAHLRALPTLPAAALSYLRARFNPGPQDHYIPPSDN